MANSDISQRNLYDRVDLGGAPTTGTRVRRSGTLVALNLVLVLVAAALIVGVAETIEGWAHFVVLGGIATTVVGTMLAVSPARRG